MRPLSTWMGGWMGAGVLTLSPRRSRVSRFAAVAALALAATPAAAAAHSARPAARSPLSAPRAIVAPAAPVEVGRVVDDEFGAPIATLAATYTIPPTPYGALGLTQQQYQKYGFYVGAAGVGLRFIGSGLSLVPVPQAQVAGRILTFVGNGLNAASVYLLYEGLNAPGVHNNFAPQEVSSAWSGLRARAAAAHSSYKIVFRPTLANYPAIQIPAPYTGTSRPLRAFLQSVLHLNELGTAFVITETRITAAKRAGARKYVLLQEKAAASYARRQSVLLFRLQGQRDAVTSALVAEGLPYRKFSQRSAAAGKQRVLAQGFSRGSIQVLRNLTAGSVAPALKHMILDTAAQQKLAAKVAPMGTSLDKALGATPAARAEDKLAGAFQGYAHVYGG